MEIDYHPLVVKLDLPKIDSVIKKKIRSAIENKLGSNPLLYGLPLRATLKPYWKLRVGDYRVVYVVSKKSIHILAISHRKDVYNLAQKRKIILNLQ